MIHRPEAIYLSRSAPPCRRLSDFHPPELSDLHPPLTRRGPARSKCAL